MTIISDYLPDCISSKFVNILSDKWGVRVGEAYISISLVICQAEKWFLDLMQVVCFTVYWIQLLSYMKIIFGFLFSAATDTENIEHHVKTKQSLSKENIPLQQCFTEETIVRNCSRIKILSVEDEKVTFELFSLLKNFFSLLVYLSSLRL